MLLTENSLATNQNHSHWYQLIVQAVNSVTKAEAIHFIAILFFSALALWLLIHLLFNVLRLIHQLKGDFVCLEVTPPQTTLESSGSITGLFTQIAGLLQGRSFSDRVRLRQLSCSFEIVSRKENGIVFLVRVPKDFVSAFEKSLRAFLPGLKVKQVADYLPLIPGNHTVKLFDFHFSKHFALPLLEPEIEAHDPLSYLTGNMTQLKEGELMALQVVLRPINGMYQLRLKQEINSLRLLADHQRLTDQLDSVGFVKILLGFCNFLEAIVRIAVTPILLLAEMITGQPTKLPEKSELVHVATPNEIELATFVSGKLGSPLFEGTVRALLLLKPENVLAREKGFRSSFLSFNHSTGQALLSKPSMSWMIFQDMNLWKFTRRVSGIPLVLSASEVGALYHFPHTKHASAEDLVRVKSPELPVPLSLKSRDSVFDIVIGENQYAGSSLPIGIPLKQRHKHMYVIGKTGMGKTTLLTSAIYQDIVSGKGVAVFDPHGDMFQELLGLIPENRKDDVIVFDPSDREWPIGLNILSPGIDFQSEEDAHEWITSSVLAVFAKLTDDKYWGPRMEHILRNATLTALQTPNPSIYTLQQLLTDKKYQKKVALTLKDPVLRQFWQKEFSLLGSMQLSSTTAPLTQRLGHFITTKMSRNILLQEKSSISLSEIMNEGKILLVNLSKGDLGEDQSRFFGTVLTSFIWMAAYQRTKIPESERRDFFLYVDEFQNFATPRFSEITSEGRKFHVSLSASHQNIAQIEDQTILKVVAGNASTIICLKASPDDEKFILPFMEPAVSKSDIVNLPPFSFFMKMATDESEEAFSGRTVPLKVRADESVRMEVVERSREQWSRPREDVEEYLNELFTGKKSSKKSGKKLEIQEKLSI